MRLLAATAGALSASAAVLAVVAAPLAALASHAPPWTTGGASIPPGTSARVKKSDQPVVFGPAANAPRRGSIARNVRLPIFGARSGPGCAGAWLAVGPFAWLCEEAVELEVAPAILSGTRLWPELSDGLPYRYFFVGPEGSAAYKRLGSVDIGEPDMQLEPGFAVAIVEEKTAFGARYGKTQHDLWVPMRDLGQVRPFAFQGADVPEGTGRIPFAWVISERARVLSKPSTGALSSAIRTKFERVPVLDEAETFGQKFLKIGDDAWLAAKDVRHPTRSDAPSTVDVAAGERWIDVDLATQTLVAYEGTRAVFATLVSTGKGKQGTPLATPKGVHRIWIKLLTSDMDNLEDDNASRYYRMESVPWVQYFSKGVGLHGAFWHRSFGNIRSHGCVNLTPLDAQKLFWWTSPHLPAGWTAVVPTPHELGAAVRVR